MDEDKEREKQSKLTQSSTQVQKTVETNKKQFDLLFI